MNLSENRKNNHTHFPKLRIFIKAVVFFEEKCFFKFFIILVMNYF